MIYWTMIPDSCSGKFKFAVFYVGKTRQHNSLNKYILAKAAPVRSNGEAETD